MAGAAGVVKAGGRRSSKKRGGSGALVASHGQLGLAAIDRQQAHRHHDAADQPEGRGRGDRRKTHVDPVGPFGVPTADGDVQGVALDLGVEAFDAAHVVDRAGQDLIDPGFVDEAGADAGRFLAARRDLHVADGRELADQAFEHYFQDEGTDSALTEAFFLHLLRNRDIAGVVRHLDMMDAEEDAIQAQKAVWRDSVGAAILQVMEQDRQRYKRRAGLSMLREMAQQYEYIGDLISQSEIIRFEVVDAQRLDYQYRATNPLIESVEERTIDFATSRDVIYWPFNGEFWDDELGYYRYTENTACN